MWRTVKVSWKGKIADLEIHPDKVSWNSNEIVIPISSIATLHEGTSLPDKILLKITPKPDTGLDPAGFLFNFSSEGQTVRNEVKEFIVSRIATSMESSISSSPVQESQSQSMKLEKDQNPSSSISSAISKQELACRVNLLSCNPQLARLHRSLVRQGGLKEEEFWSQRSSLLKETAWRLEQTRGIPAILPESIATPLPEPGKKNLTLTPQAIQAIFAQFPAVQKAYIQNVPLKQTEREFWSQFFTSRNLLYDAKNVDDFIGQFNEQSKNILHAQLGPTGLMTVNGIGTLKDALQGSQRPIVKEIKNSHFETNISQISFPEEIEEGIGVDNWNKFMEVYFTEHSQGTREKAKALSVGEANSAALAFEFQRHIWSGSARKVELAEKIPQIPLLVRSIERAKQIAAS